MPIASQTKDAGEADRGEREEHVLGEKVPAWMSCALG
jgi:hypothetical protein